MPKINWVIKQRRLQLIGHCIRYTDELVHNLILWKPKNGIPYNIYVVYAYETWRHPKTSLYIFIHYKETLSLLIGDKFRTLMKGPRNMENNNMLCSSDNYVIRY